MKTLQFGETAEKKMNWLEAQCWIDSLNESKYLGFNDWRLPTRVELIDAYGNKVEGFKSDYYWSSTTDVYSTADAWGVNFSYGGVGSVNKANGGCVRPVRGGQCVGNLKIKKSDIKREAVKLSQGMIGRLK